MTDTERSGRFTRNGAEDGNGGGLPRYPQAQTAVADPGLAPPSPDESATAQNLQAPPPPPPAERRPIPHPLDPSLARPTRANIRRRPRPSAGDFTSDTMLRPR